MYKKYTEINLATNRYLDVLPKSGGTPVSSSFIFFLHHPEQREEEVDPGFAIFKKSPAGAESWL